MKHAKPKSKNELLPGTLEMLILKTLSIESMHGYGIAQHIQMLSADVLTIEEGSLYPALQRMLVKRWVLAEWKISANNRRARFYTLTTAGKMQLGVVEGDTVPICAADRGRSGPIAGVLLTSPTNSSYRLTRSAA
jgi:transcriptional regulator